MWNRTVNGSRRGKNIALDLDHDHSNYYLIQAITKLGQIFNEQPISRICGAERGTRNLQRRSDSGKHCSVSPHCDLPELVKRLLNNRRLEELPARQYRHFSNFETKPFKNIDASSFYKSINGHTKECENWNLSKTGCSYFKILLPMNYNFWFLFFFQTAAKKS